MQFVCDFATRETATDNNNVVTDLFLIKQEFARFHSLFDAGNSKSSCDRTRCDDHFVRVELANIFDFGVIFYFDAEVFDLLLVPLDEFFIFLFEGRRCRCYENTAEIV